MCCEQAPIGKCVRFGDHTLRCLHRSRLCANSRTAWITRTWSGTSACTRSTDREWLVGSPPGQPFARVKVARLGTTRCEPAIRCPQPKLLRRLPWSCVQVSASPEDLGSSPYSAAAAKRGSHRFDAVRLDTWRLDPDGQPQMHAHPVCKSLIIRLGEAEGGKVVDASPRYAVVHADRVNLAGALRMTAVPSTIRYVPSRSVFAGLG
jgi:hypothetical protein